VTERNISRPDEGTPHIDEMTCLLYIERQLDRARAQEVSAHLQDCTACRTLLRALERESRLLTRAMLEEEEALPTRLAQFQERARRSMQWIWALAFGLAATGLYALYTEYVGPLQRQLEQAGFGGSNLLGLLIFQSAMWKGWQSMITLFEVLALATLAGFGFALFRRRLRRATALAVVLAGVCVAIMTPTASAIETRKGDSIEVAQGETIKGDIYIFAHRARIEGTIDGDLFLFSSDADVTGHVTGDVISFAQSLRINGQVDGNVRTAVNNVTVRGTVAKNMTCFAETLTLDSAGKIGGSLTTFTKTLSLDGRLGRDLMVMAEHADISGTIAGSVRAKAQGLTISGRAKIDGPIRYDGDKPADVSSQAKLASPVEFHRMEHKPKYMEGHYYIWRTIWTAAFILFGMVLVLLMPNFAEEVVRSAETYAAPIGLGVLVLFGVPIAAIIACITVVGIPLAVLTVGFWILMLCSAELVVGAVVGSWILGVSRDTWGLIGRMAIGFILVRIVYTFMEHVHILNFIGALAIWTWGMGAISLAIYRRLEPKIGAGVPSGAYAMPPGAPAGGMQPA
jgi:cytoskeletal protein CcmA (bactofilin family)